MFTKTLIATAILALSTNAVKLKSQLKLNALAGVNVKALSKTELKSLLASTSEEWQEYENTYSKSYMTEEENEARQT